EEHQPCARFLAGNDRSHHSGCGRRGPCAEQGTRAGIERAKHRPSGPDVRAEHADLRHRPHQRPVRPGPYGGIRGVRVHGLYPLEVSQMLPAQSEVQVDTSEVRGTQWRLAPGSATGHHIHEMDYVIVPVTAGEMTIVAPNGELSKARLGLGKSYFRK